MLSLMLLRHAKSSWADPGQADMDRPLNARGQHAARAMGRHMACHDLVPSLVLCSPALRARETWEVVAGELKNSPPLLIDPDIYDFEDSEKLLDCLRRKGGVAPSVLLVGHNPTIAALAQKMSMSGSKKQHRLMEEKYPTCALAVISIEIDTWQELTKGAGTLQRFDRPKDILGEDQA